MSWLGECDKCAYMFEEADEWRAFDDADNAESVGCYCSETCATEACQLAEPWKV